MLKFNNCRKLYVYVDADKVGDLLELHLLDGNVDAAGQVHINVQNAIQHLRARVLEIPTAEIVFSGCDDVLFTLSSETYDKRIIDEIRELFYQETELSISAGVGHDVPSSLLNLRRAKLSGRNRLVEILD